MSEYERTPSAGGGGGSAPDATTSTKGLVKLAGQLGGTADLPTVPDLGTTAQRQFANLKQRFDRLQAAAGAIIDVPQDRGLLAANGPLSLANLTSGFTGGAVFYYKVRVLEDITVSNCNIYFTAAGATMTTCFMGIYDSAGTQLRISADVSTLFQTSGLIAVPLTSPLAIAGGDTKFVYVAVLVGGGTTFSAARFNATIGQMNAGYSTANAPCIRSAATGLTALPPSFTPSGANTANAQTQWVGLS